MPTVLVAIAGALGAVVRYRIGAKLGFIVALDAGRAAPIAGLAGLDPITPLDSTAAQAVGLAVAIAVIMATTAAQMGRGVLRRSNRAHRPGHQRCVRPGPQPDLHRLLLSPGTRLRRGSAGDVWLG